MSGVERDGDQVCGGESHGDSIQSELRSFPAAQREPMSLTTVLREPGLASAAPVAPVEGAVAPAEGGG